jgi:hypothetical protein
MSVKSSLAQSVDEMAFLQRLWWRQPGPQWSFFFKNVNVGTITTPAIENYVVPQCRQKEKSFNHYTYTKWPLRRHRILCKSLRVISFRSWKWPLYASWRYCFCLSKICRNSTCCTLCLSTLCLLALWLSTLWLSTLWFLALWLSRIQRNALDEKPAAGTLTHNQGDQIWVIVYAYFEQFFKVTKVAEICWAILSAVKVLYYLWQK